MRNEEEISSVLFSRSVASDSLRCHGLQHTRPPCPSPIPGVYLNSYPLSWWCHPTISSSVVPFSSLQSFPASGSFPKSQFFASGGQSIGVSALASVLPMNIQDWFPLGWTGWILPLSNICGNGSTKRLTNARGDTAAELGAGSQSQPQTASTVCNNSSTAHGSRVSNLEADPLGCLVAKSCLTLLQLHGL